MDQKASVGIIYFGKACLLPNEPSVHDSEFNMDEGKPAGLEAPVNFAERPGRLIPMVNLRISLPLSACHGHLRCGLRVMFPRLADPSASPFLTLRLHFPKSWV
jgi:hypothetical protein